LPKTVGPINSYHNAAQSYKPNTTQLDRLHFKKDGYFYILLA